MRYTERMRKKIGVTALIYVLYIVSGQFITPSLAQAQITTGCHTPTADEVSSFTVLDQKAPGQICPKDLNMVTGGCPTSPYPFLLQHYKPGAASAAAGNKGITMLNADFACRLSKFIQAYPQVNIVSAYRSPTTQAQLFNAAVQKYGSAAAARKWVAPPPCSAETNAVTCGNGSNHNRGLAADLSNITTTIQKASAQFQLHFPLSNEMWHIEPSGTVNNKTVTPGDEDGTGSAPTNDPSTQPSCNSLYQCATSCGVGQTVVSVGPPLVCASQPTNQSQCAAGTGVLVSGVMQCVAPQNQCAPGSVFSNGFCYPLNGAAPTAQAAPAPAQASQPTGASSPSSSGSPASSLGSTPGTSQTGISSILSGITSGTPISSATTTTATSPSVSTQLYNLMQSPTSSVSTNTSSNTGGSIALNSDSTDVSQLNPFSQSLSQIGVSSGSNSVSTAGQGSEDTGVQGSSTGSSNVIRSTQPAFGSQTFTSTDLRGSGSDTYSPTPTTNSSSAIERTQAILTDLRIKLTNALVYLRHLIAGR
ncbi:MAG: hypothetical protein JWO50_752 [Candidatus Kaiserbacteria bacterium]|nr:hypothetical protein [Candidatus Kaiserbacteria bacterium]